MKHNIRFKLFGLFAVAAMFLTAACQRDPLSEAVSDVSDYASVSFSIQPETHSATTRANKDDVDYTKPKHISDGQDVDLLVYAVYKVTGEGTGEEKAELETELDKIVSDEVITASNSVADEFGRTPGPGQIFMKINPNGTEGVDRFPVTVEIKLRRDETYRVAFWAQNSKCDAYDINDLTRVQVHYKEYKEGDSTTGPEESAASVTPNNDELRDAFCRVEKFKLQNKNDEYRTVYLYRPLAQINVGTTGYDYETVVQDKRYAYTRMQIITAARYLDVVNDKISTNDNDNGEYGRESGFEFGWAPIPAYYKYDKSELTSEDFDFANVDYDKEEFLRVHLYDDNYQTQHPEFNYMPKDGDGFLQYATLKNDNYKTETFKWLSMGYVLVPSQTNVKDDGSTEYSKTTIGRVRVWIATDEQGTNAKEIVNISNVDATRNWRTNIVGDIMTANVNLQVVLDPIYAGDYNGFYQGGEVTWSGPLDGLESGGAYYDAENDEILISNANGLLWFQQMVNGKLRYTVDNPRTAAAKADVPIHYFAYDGTDTCFGAAGEPAVDGIEDPTIVVEREKNKYNSEAEYQKAMAAAEELKARILRATHQDTNLNTNGWPANNNFHFVGTKKEGNNTVADPANVKLVADIDLSGIEWLGIGFDCKMDQTSDMLIENDNDRVTGDAKVYKAANNRAFFGNFDGNNHTVSNLTTKRFSVEVHPYSYQINSPGPYETVQWYARGFFGQIGGEATVKNLTLRNVNIYGNHCVGGIVGAAIGVDPKQKKGKAITIENCIVDGGRIENVPMFRGDLHSANGRTYARGVFTGGIVGMYNATGSVTGCSVRNLIIDGYRTVGGIVGGILHYYDAYVTTSDFSKRESHPDSKIEPEKITDNHISNTIVMADHFKPFSYLRHISNYEEDITINGTKEKYTADWAIGYSWGMGYGSYCRAFVGGDDSYDQNKNEYKPDYFTDGNYDDGDVKVVDFAGYYRRDDSANKILARTTDIDNVPLEELPMLSNWFVDEVKILNNLLGTPSAYKRYKTHETQFHSENPNAGTAQVPFDLPRVLDVDWDTNTGRVGMHVGAIKVDGKINKSDDTYENVVISARDVTGENDCVIQITSCDRKQFTGNTNTAWYTSAETTLENLSVRGNPYAYTGICLSPNECMSTINIRYVAVYDVYQTLALDNLEKNTGDVWPKEIKTSGVTLNVEYSNLRGYTVPGAGWKQISYTSVVFERGSHISENQRPDQIATEYTCKVESATTFDKCKFKAPYIVDFSGATDVVTFTGCQAVYGDSSNVTADIQIPEGKNCTKIVVDESGNVTYFDAGGKEIATAN